MDDGGIRLEAKARALVAEYGAELVEQVLDLRRTAYTAPQVADRGKYVMRLLRDETTESRRARDAERPLGRSNAGQPAPGYRDPAAIARRAAERAETDEERDRRRKEEAEKKRADDRAQLEAQQAYFALSDRDREELHARARAELSEIQREHEPSIRFTAIGLLRDSFQPLAKSRDSFSSRRTQNAARGPKINGLRVVSETMSAWSFG